MLVPIPSAKKKTTVGFVQLEGIKYLLNMIGVYACEIHAIIINDESGLSEFKNRKLQTSCNSYFWCDAILFVQRHQRDAKASP